ncbi:hypothetical protein JMG10_07780 [Nostoc ellipsosporum NOK]|nr:hypothetical protein [Nostoc ellipsosporum NOK]
MSNKQRIEVKGKNPVNQAGRFSAELKALKPDVTAEDRSALQQEHFLSRATISRYLSGEVRDNDTAALIIQFFKTRIAERYKAIEQ